MKTRNTLILTGLLIYLLFLLIKLPASVAYPFVKNSINGPDMVGLKGSLWSGHATSMQVMNQSFRNVYWEFHPFALLLGSVDMDIDIRDPQYPFKAVVSTGMISGDLEAEQVKGTLPAGILQQFPVLALVSLSGELHINIKRLLLVDNEPRAADGEILISQAYLQQPLQTKIGTIQLKMTDQDNQVQVKIKDQQAPIAIDGTLKLQAGHKYSFSARLNPGADADNSLISMLRNVSRLEADGTMNIQYNGVY